MGALFAEPFSASKISNSMRTLKYSLPDKYSDHTFHQLPFLLYRGSMACEIHIIPHCKRWTTNQGCFWSFVDKSKLVFFRVLMITGKTFCGPLFVPFRMSTTLPTSLWKVSSSKYENLKTWTPCLTASELASLSISLCSFLVTLWMSLKWDFPSRKMRSLRATTQMSGVCVLSPKTLDPFPPSPNLPHVKPYQPKRDGSLIYLEHWKKTSLCFEGFECRLVFPMS